MTQINSISDIREESSKIKRDITEAKTLKAINILVKRTKILLKKTSDYKYRSDIKRAARSEYRALNKLINTKKKQLK